jgi:DNA-binding response OmpR family regulator
MADLVLLLTADEDLAESMMELLALEGLSVATVAGIQPVHVVVADLDAWPADWDLRLLRQRLGRVPCLLLSGSPFAGPYTATTLTRGYFVPKPFSPNRLLAVLRRCISEGSLGC